MKVDGKVILITGGTGSFGRAFLKHLFLTRQPQKVIIYSRDEWKQNEMAEAIKRWSASLTSKAQGKIRFFIGDVRDKERLVRAMQGADVVVHAAALKRIEACEYNPVEAVKTNVLGALNVIEAAIDTDVQRVIAISSDKAVAPLNLYGATKMVAEKLFVQANVYARNGRPSFSVVRYGNVMGSRGSVLSLWKTQLERGDGFISITQQDCTRFWMTLRQASQFVLDALEEEHRGLIYVPFLPTFRLKDLAETVAAGIPVREIGLRPGEKVHEVLISGQESGRTIPFQDKAWILPELRLWEIPRLEGYVSRPFGLPYSSEYDENRLEGKALVNALKDVEKEDRDGSS